MRQNGTVKFFNASKGYGFITPDDGGKDVFVHVTAVERSGIPTLTDGMRISFETEPDKRRRGCQCLEIPSPPRGAGGFLCLAAPVGVRAAQPTGRVGRLDVRCSQAVGHPAPSARSCRGAGNLTEEAPGSYFSAMRSVGLKVLKNKLSEYVRLAAGGETVLVTDRDRVVAEIVPPRGGRSPFLADALLAEAVRNGWITPPTLASDVPPPRRPVMSFAELMQDLESDRQDR